MGLTLWVTAIVASGAWAEILWETYDAAGMSLQMEHPQGGLWWSGHHSNIGVRHPGPAFMLLTWFGSVLHATAGFAASPLGAQITILAAVKAGAIVSSAALVGSALRSRTAALVFLLSVLSLARVGPWDGSVYSWRFWDLLDLTGRGLHVTAAACVLLLLAAALAWARGVRRADLVLVLAGGLAMHVHASTLPIGLLAICAGLWSSFQRRHKDPRGLVLTITAASAFALPVLVRMIVEPGWPLSYFGAARLRYAQRLEQGDTSGDPFLALGHLVGLPGVVVVAGLALLVIVGAALWWFGYRREGAVCAVPAAYCLAVAVAGPDGQPAATELLWVGGAVAFLVGVLPALLVAKVARDVQMQNSLPLIAGLLPVLVLAAVLAGAQPLANTAGPKGEYVPHAADAVEQWHQKGQEIRWEIDSSWLETSAGVLLELERRGVPWCAWPSSEDPPLESPGWFFPDDRLCASPPTIGGELIEEPIDGSCTVFSYLPSRETRETQGDFPLAIVARSGCGVRSSSAPLAFPLGGSGSGKTG